MGYSSASFDPSQPAANSDAASSATAKASDASSVAAAAGAAAAAASSAAAAALSKIAAQSSAWEAGGGFGTITPGGFITAAADSENHETPYSLTMLKEIVVGGSGEYRVSFAMKRTAGSGGYGRIYRQTGEETKVAVGTQQNISSSWVTYSQDISGWTAGDKCQLWAQISGELDVKEFRVGINIDGSEVTLD